MKNNYCRMILGMINHLYLPSLTTLGTPLHHTKHCSVEIGQKYYDQDLNNVHPCI